MSIWGKMAKGTGCETSDILLNKQFILSFCCYTDLFTLFVYHVQLPTAPGSHHTYIYDLFAHLCDLNKHNPPFFHPWSGSFRAYSDLWVSEMCDHCQETDVCFWSWSLVLSAAVCSSLSTVWFSVTIIPVTAKESDHVSVSSVQNRESPSGIILVPSGVSMCEKGYRFINRD